MEQNKLPPTPWYSKSMKVVGEESTRIMDRSGFYIAHQEGIRSLEERDYISNSIVSAVNNTLGAGIRPESVPDLLKALNLIAKHFFHEGNNSHESFGLQSIYKAAIEKSKL